MNTQINPENTQNPAAPPSPAQLPALPGITLNLPPVSDINAPLSMRDDMVPESVTNPLFMPGYLRTQLGKLMRVDSLIGTTIISHVGFLTKVGASYIVLTSLDNQNDNICDLYSIKFIDVLAKVTPENIVGLLQH